MNILIGLKGDKVKSFSELKGDLLFYLCLLAYIALTFFLCYKLTIWEDESYSLYTTANSFKKVIHLSYLFEANSILL